MTESHIAINPFIYARPLYPDEFFNRESLRDAILSKLLTTQSTFIVGDPQIGKTSLLRYVQDFAATHPQCTTYLFSFVDASTVEGQFTPAQFWQQSLEPLRERLDSKLAEVSDTYYTAKENRFGTYVLERMFRKLDEIGQRFVLMIDDFDLLLNHQVLNTVEFWGGMRTISSRVKGLTLLIASCKTRTQVDRIVGAVGGSPFTTFGEIVLPAFPDSISEALLRKKAEGTFMDRDYTFIKKIARGQPYLLQATAALIWQRCQEYKNLETSEMIRFYATIAWECYREFEMHFMDTWRNCDNASRKVITVIGLSQMGRLLEGHKFDVENLMENPKDFEVERKKLADRGILRQIGEDQWEIAPQSFLWWLADELKRHIRDQSDFESWLQRNEMSGLLTKGEKEKLGKFAEQIVQAIGQGAVTLIQSFAKGFGEGLGKAVVGKT